MPPTLFISDLHLCAARPAINALFLAFLRERASRAQTLYILGDLFEYWIGDEAATQAEHRPLIAGLRALTAAGIPVYVMPGNRDFLLGPGFERASGCRLLADPTRIDLYGSPVLLAHGDALCTGDTQYMTFRSMVRQGTWQQDFLALPLAEREARARNYRELSKLSTASKQPEIMDVAQAAVETVMREHGVRDMIHGHTHRPADHRFTLDGQPARRVVLGDWYEQGSVLRCDAHTWVLESLPLNTGKSEQLRKI
jgi:UDP-2,3-diacylglucosamine hydrolase